VKAGRQVQWRVIEPMWSMEGIDQVQIVTWTLESYEVNTLVSLRMEGQANLKKRVFRFLVAFHAAKKRKTLLSCIINQCPPPFWLQNYISLRLALTLSRAHA
jgi:hypothetical protein